MTKSPRKGQANNNRQAPASSNSQNDLILRLTRENMQLRRDLEDANVLIRELERKQRIDSLLMPIISYDDDPEDDFSVEVSVTSSVTTVPTGTLSRNAGEQNGVNQQDVKEKSLYSIFRQQSAKEKRLARRVNNRFPELRRLFSNSSSVSDCSSMSSAASAEGSASSLSTHASDAMLTKAAATSRKNDDNVSSYAMYYFQRTESSDNDSNERRCEI